MAGSGFGVDTGEMGGVADKIDGTEKNVTGDADKVGKSDIVAADFGRAHTDRGTPFNDMLAALSKLLTAQGEAMTNYTSLMRDNTGAYDTNEWANKDLFTKKADS